MIRHVAALITAVVIFYGCSTNPGDDQANGGDDFPNAAAIEAMGPHIAQGLQGNSQWNANMTATTSLPAPSSDAAVEIPQPPASSGMGKRLAAYEDTITTTIDTSSSTDSAIYIVRAANDTIIGIDTIIIKKDALFYDGLENTNHVVYASATAFYKSSGAVIIARYLDADSDGIINNESAVTCRATVFFSSSLSPLGYQSSMLVDAGPDNNFNTAIDNRIVSSWALATRNNDTLSYAAFSDADGDGFAIDPAYGDSCLIDVAYLTATPLLSRTLMQARYVIFPADSTKNYPIRFSSTEQRLSGGATYAAITGPHDDSCFYANDTVVARIVSITATGTIDTLIYTAKQGNTPRDSIDDSLMAVYTHTVHTAGLERDIIFSFVSNTPLAAGEGPVAGTVTYAVTYRDNSWIRAEGTYTASAITLHFTDASGNDVTVIFDREGNFVEADTTGQ